MDRPGLLVAVSVAVVGLGIAVAALSSRKASPVLTSSDRLLLIGDSLGVGLLPKLDAQAGEQGIEISGAPVGGTTVKSWVGRSIKQMVDAGESTAALIVLGSNDAAATQQYVDELEGYARKLIERIREAGVSKIIWLAPGETGALKHAAQVQQIIALVCSQMSVEYLEVPDSVEYSKWDYIHLTPAGYGQLASWVLEQTTLT